MCKYGCISVIKNMLEKLGDKAINVLQDSDEDGDTALHIVCRNSHIELAKFIIEKLGCLASNIIQNKTSYNKTLLIIALQNNQVELINMMITTLIDNNYDINNILKNNSYNAYNFLMLACLKGDTCVIQHLINYGATMDVEDIYAWSDVFKKNILKGNKKCFDSIILCNKIDTNSIKIFEIIINNLDKYYNNLSST